MRLKNLLWAAAVAALALVVGPSASAADGVEYLPGKPLVDVVSATLKPVSPGTLLVPIITWGGDVPTILAESAGIFKSNGLDVKLSLKNDMRDQVRDCVGGTTPFIRGELGQVIQASEACEKAGVKMVIITQLTWSHGGDCIVVRSDRIKKIADIKTITMQAYGPHNAYVAQVLSDAGLDLKNVRFNLTQEITLTDGKTDPRTAFAKDATNDAAAMIDPDAQTLTSGGKIGTGSEDSVKSALIKVSTKEASRVLPDTYAAREDWFNQHRDQAQKFVISLLQGQDKLREMQQQGAKSSEYAQLLKKSATLLFGAAEATKDVEGLLSGCDFVGAAGCKAFFTGVGTTNNLETLNAEIQPAFLKMGLLRSRPTILGAVFDWDSLGKGLAYAADLPQQTKFDTAKIERDLASESSSFGDEGTLFQLEIYFEPNQTDFPLEKYREPLEKAARLFDKYGDTVLSVEGHNEPTAIAKAKREGKKSSAELEQMVQKAKNTSQERAQAVMKTFIDYCRNTRNLQLNQTRFIARGRGIEEPKYPEPTTKEEWAQNRRVVFKILTIESESSSFEGGK